MLLTITLHTGKGSVNRIRKVSTSKERTVKDNGFYYSTSNFLNHFWITLETEYESLFLNETLLTTGVDIIEMQEKREWSMYVCTM